MTARRRPRADERGSITPLVPIVVLVFLVLGGLIVDGSRDLDARGEAQAFAEEAARAGATAVDLRSDDLALDEALAVQRITAYCAAVTAQPNTPVLACGLDPARRFTDATTCNGNTARIVVNTVVRTQIDTTLLGIVGLQTLSAEGRAKARPYEGTTAGNAC